MTTIDEFKAQLIDGGPRANRFKVFLPRAGNNIEFLCKAASIPAAVIGEVPVNFRGSILKLAGDRTFENWSVTIINDADFSVLCDETNNTDTVIDRNEFVCSIFVKPARSINYITLNFVAARSGVEFSEIYGAV